MKTQILSIGTAVPKNKISQNNILKFMTDALNMNASENNKLAALYRSTGISSRHSVLSDYNNSFEDFVFFPKNKSLDPFPTIGDRMDLYKKYALPLCVEAITDCIDAIHFQKKEITHIITVSCTGMYAPGLDIELVEELNLATDTLRTAINFMGCYAAINALRVADYICKANAKATILLVCVELCTIHFQKNKTEDNLLSNALFADGAAALLISNNKEEGSLSLSVEEMYSDMQLAGKKDMAWHIGDFGFEMILSSYVPDVIQQGIKKLCNKLLEKLPIEYKDIDFFAIHPGGKRILEVVEKELLLPKKANFYAYQILSNYGNMSSPTVLFVLKEIWKNLNKADNQKTILSLAFGPGLTVESALLKVNW